MNMHLLLSFLFLFLIAPSAVLAQTDKPSPAVSPTASAPKKSPTVSPTPAENLMDKLKQIKILKEKIATKVAELREKEMAAIAGTVKAVAANSMTITSVKGERVITISEDVQVFLLSNSSRTPSTAEKIKQGDSIAAIGYVEDAKQTLVASYIYIQNRSIQHFSGKITNIDRTNFTITIKEKLQEILVDIEKNTRTAAYDAKQDALVRAGFSKLAVGDTVHIAATPNVKEEQRFSALRIAAINFDTGTLPTTATTPTKAASGSASPTKKVAASPTEKPTVVTKTPTPPKTTAAPKPTS